MTTDAHAVPPLVYSVEGAAARLGVGRTTLFALIRRGDLRVIRLGRRTLIREADLVAFLAARAGRGAT
jgi:excisionase family DNA binding protein